MLTHHIRTLTILLVCLAGTLGCATKQQMAFPSRYNATRIGDAPEQRAYDTDQNDRPDYNQYFNEQGRVVRLAFDLDQDGSLDQQVDLDKLDLANCRQLYILLDGVPYQIIADMYEKGYFRLFHKPSRLISSFPSMTDVAFAEIFDLSPVLAYEASYYDFADAKLHDGNTVYLSGENEPWNQRLDYRSRMWMDAVAYLKPNWWLDHELQAILSKYLESNSKRVSGYSVASTCLGTRDGSEGYREVLLQLEKICQTAMFASKGKVKITVFSDHGHNLTPAKPLPLKDLLKEAGFNVVNKLNGPKDVIVPEFGLVTYASIETFSPAKVASDVVHLRGINLAMYEDPDGNIAVLSSSGYALITKQGDRYRYHNSYGDPLKLSPAIAQLSKSNLLDEQGYAADDDWFNATARHGYPDPLARIWRAFHGLVKNTPAVVITTKDGWYCGKGNFSSVVQIASTHGSLNYANSVTFAMTTAGPLPPDLRVKDLFKALVDLGLEPP